MLDVCAVTGACNFGAFGADVGAVVGAPAGAASAVEPPAVAGATTVARATLLAEVPPETPLLAANAEVALLAIVTSKVKPHSVALKHRTRKTTSFVGLRG